MHIPFAEGHLFLTEKVMDIPDNATLAGFSDTTKDLVNDILD
jgi:hypothetical protein